jgi:hypothetical protein
LKAKANEIGYLNTNFKQDGVAAETKTVSTILEVTLAILPNSKTTLP